MQNQAAMLRNPNTKATILGPRTSPEKALDPYTTPWTYQFGDMYSSGHVLRHRDDLFKHIR